MVGKFKKNVKYKKKNFNIYNRFINLKSKFVKKSQKEQINHKKLRFKDLSEGQKNKFDMEKESRFSIFDLFKL